MEKKYREMTAEERIRVIQAAMNKDGFVELKKIVDEYETLLIDKPETVKPSIHITDENMGPIIDIINKEGLAGFANTSNDITHSLVEEGTPTSVGTPNPEQGSIYAPEHRPVAMGENGIAINSLEHPKTRILGPVQSGSAPNPWGDAEVVSPGTIKL